MIDELIMNTLRQIVIKSIFRLMEVWNIRLIIKLQPEANVSCEYEHPIYRDSYSVYDNKVAFANHPIKHETS